MSNMIEGIRRNVGRLINGYSRAKLMITAIAL